MNTRTPGTISYGRPPQDNAAGPRFDEGPAPARESLDWITEFAIPLGVIGLLSSFLYYLIHLRSLVGGGASGALMWVCFFFLLGTVFVTRVRTKYGEAAIAAPYIIGLAAAIGLFMWRFTMWSGALVGTDMRGGRLTDLMFNYAVVALIWYAASRLTRECTAEETTRRAGEEGMLDDLAPRADRQRLRGLGHRRAPRHPGWLVMWFSLVAVIVFALGQRSTTSVEGESAPFAFRCLVAYLFFAMALLALTSLSALRMLARRRRLALSGAVAPVWVWVSAIAICAVLAAAGVLPRRESERRERAGDALSWARGEQDQGGRDAPLEGQRRLQEQRRAGEGDEEEASGGAEAGAEGAGESEGEGGGRQPDGTDPGAGAGGQASTGQTQSGQGAGQGQGAAQQPPQPDRSLMWLLRLLMALLLALLALFLLYRFGRVFIAWLRRVTGLRIGVPPVLVALLQRLRAALARLLFLLSLRRLGKAVAAQAQGIDPQSLADPFRDRSLADKPPAEKVRHVYRAMLAYADLLGCPRLPEQTPFEYLRELPASLAPMRTEAQALTGYFVQASYTPQAISDEQVESLKGIWTALQTRIDAALTQGAGAG